MDRRACVSKKCGRCFVAHCGYLIVVPRSMPARLCERTPPRQKKGAIGNVSGARQHHAIIADNAKALS
jgi:sigma54-dependent transcription regulator